MLYLSPAITIYACALSAVFGACMGSFLNCMAWRIVHGESVLRGRSHCDACGHTLGIGDLVPVVSYLVHGGKCRYCGAKLAARHVWGEIISAAVFVSLLLRYDITLQMIEYWVLAALLLCCSFADLEGYIIPDRFIVAGLIVRLVFLLAGGHIGSALLDAALGGIAIPAVLLGIVLVMEKVWKREAMGGGDLKLLALTGVFLGWQLNLLTLLLACFLGIVFALATQKQRQGREDAALFPWGPSIAAAAWLALLFGRQLITAYMGLF